MPTRIRLQRKGKKGQPFYHLVVADGRAPRDGKFIEKLGTYNPMTHPATIELDFDRALYWVNVGAQPSDTARSILSHKGVLLKYHLLRGVTKGALTEEQVEEKFQAWVKEKEEKVHQISKDKELTEKEKFKKSLEDEKKVDEARAAELAKKRAVALKKAASAGKPEAEETEVPEVKETEVPEVTETEVPEVAEPEVPEVTETEVPEVEDKETPDAETEAGTKKDAPAPAAE